MKFQKIIFLFILSFALSNATFSQVILKGYILNLNGDSVKGEIKISKGILKKTVYEQLRYYVEFKNESAEKFTKYNPKDILEFGYVRDDSSILKYFPEKTGKKRYYFLCLITDGPLRLYHDYYIGTYTSTSLTGSGMQRIKQMTNIFIKKKEFEVLEIEDNWQLNVKKRKSLRAYLSECPVIENELSNPDELKINDIVNKYNEWYLQNKK